jgi:hypothetical protein
MTNFIIKLTNMSLDYLIVPYLNKEDCLNMKRVSYEISCLNTIKHSLDNIIPYGDSMFRYDSYVDAHYNCIKCKSPVYLDYYGWEACSNCLTELYKYECKICNVTLRCKNTRKDCCGKCTECYGNIDIYNRENNIILMKHIPGGYCSSCFLTAKYRCYDCGYRLHITEFQYSLKTNYEYIWRIHHRTGDTEGFYVINEKNNEKINPWTIRCKDKCKGNVCIYCHLPFNFQDYDKNHDKDYDKDQKYCECQYIIHICNEIRIKKSGFPCLFNG